MGIGTFILDNLSVRTMATAFQWGSDFLHPMPAVNTCTVGTDKFIFRECGLMKFGGNAFLTFVQIPAGAVFTSAILRTRALAVNAQPLLVIANVLKGDDVWDIQDTDGVWRAIDQSRLDDEIGIRFKVNGPFGSFDTGIAAPIAGVLTLSFGGPSSEISQMGQSILRPDGALGIVSNCQMRMGISAAGSSGTVVMDIYDTVLPGVDHRPNVLIATSDSVAASSISTAPVGTDKVFNFIAEPWVFNIGDHRVGVIRSLTPLSAGVSLRLISADDPTFGGPFAYDDGNISRFENGDAWGTKNYLLNEELPLQRLATGAQYVPNADQIEGNFIAFVAPLFFSDFIISPPVCLTSNSASTHRPHA